MKNNTIYTAKELLETAGFNAEVIGKVRVRIGGIAGIVTPEHLINTGHSEKIDVLVGADLVTLELENQEEVVLSEGAKAVKDAEREENIARFDAHMEAKKAPKE